MTVVEKHLGKKYVCVAEAELPGCGFLIILEILCSAGPRDRKEVPS